MSGSQRHAGREKNPNTHIRQGRKEKNATLLYQLTLVGKIRRQFKRLQYCKTERSHFIPPRRPCQLQLSEVFVL